MGVASNKELTLFTSFIVSIKNRNAQYLEDIAHCAFAWANATCDANFNHAMKLGKGYNGIEIIYSCSL